MNIIPTTLYRHFDSNDNLLYVGISLNEFNRFKQHMVNSDWPTDAAYTNYERFDTREEALLAEKQAIVNEKPLYNKIHNNTLKRLFKRLDQLGQNINKDKNPILDYSERFNKRIAKAMHEYDTIRGLLDESDWFGFCNERRLHPGHCGSCWIGHGGRDPGPYID